MTEQGEALLAQARTRTQIVIEENEADAGEARKLLPIPLKSGRSWLANSGLSFAKDDSRKFLLSIGAVVLLLTLGAFFLHADSPACKPRARRLHPDRQFLNTTGDPVFDDSLRQGLKVQLEQSPSLSLVSEDRIRQALSLMGQSAGWLALPGRSLGGVRAYRQFRRSRGLHQASRKRIRAGPSIRRLPHRREDR